MRRISLSLLALAAAGCVTQGTYDELKAQHDATKVQLTERERENADLKATLHAEEEKVRTLDAQVKKAEADIAAMLKDKSALESSVEEMKTALGELQKRKAEAEARLAEFRNLLSRFKSLIDAGKLEVKIVEGRMVVKLATDVLFSSGSAQLSKDGKTAVAEVAGVLASIPNRKFQVEGHTDNVPIATAQYPSNWELAAARALTVVKTMTESGMPADRISAASFGDAKPVQANDTPEGKSANRRIEIVVVPDLSSLPGFDELNKLGS